MNREYTNKLLEMVEEGILDKDVVIMAFVNFLSEDKVKEMMEDNDMIEDEEEEDDNGEDLDNFNWVGSRHHY